MNTAVIYKSYLDSTKKYAQWIAHETEGDLFRYSTFKKEDFPKYQRIIVMSATYFGRMPLTKYLKDNWEAIKDKTIVALAVGPDPENDPWRKKSYESIPEEIRKGIKYYKLHGKMIITSPDSFDDKDLEEVRDLIRNI